MMVGGFEWRRSEIYDLTYDPSQSFPLPILVHTKNKVNWWGSEASTIDDWVTGLRQKYPWPLQYCTASCYSHDERRTIEQS